MALGFVVVCLDPVFELHTLDDLGRVMESPDLAPALLGDHSQIRLHTPGQVIQPVGRLVHPAALVPGLGVHFVQRRPEA